MTIKGCSSSRPKKILPHTVLVPDVTSCCAGPESCIDKFCNSKLYVFIVHSLLEEWYYIWSWPFEINYLLLKEKQLLLQLHKYSCFPCGQEALPAAPYSLQEAAAAGSTASTSLCFHTSSTAWHKAHLEESPLRLSDVASILNLSLFCCRKINRRLEVSYLSYQSLYLFIAPTAPWKSQSRRVEQPSLACKAMKLSAARDPLTPATARWARSARADLLRVQYPFPASILFIIILLFLEIRSIFKSWDTECQTMISWGASQARSRWKRRNLTQSVLERTIFSKNVPAIIPLNSYRYMGSLERRKTYIFRGTKYLLLSFHLCHGKWTPLKGRFRWLSTDLMS